MTEAEYQNRQRYNLAVTLDNRRHELGLTMTQLSKASGVNRRMIGEILAGKGSPTLRTLLRVTRAMDLTVMLAEPDQTLGRSNAVPGYVGVVS